MTEIIIVDDSPEDFEALLRAFKKVGSEAKITHIDDGNLAVEQIQQSQPVLILLDLNMPEMEGTELLKLLKNNPSTFKIPCIIFSTSTNARDIDSCYQLGANAYLQKPINFSDYLTIAQHIDNFWIKANKVSMRHEQD